MRKFKIISVWMLAFVLTLGAAVFQRMTGPTYPVRAAFNINGNVVKVKLPRSLETGSGSKVSLPIADHNVKGVVSYRLYPSSDPFTKDTIINTGSEMTFTLPEQAAAGKLEYMVSLQGSGFNYESPVLHLRYKDPVPGIWLIPHILIMFLAMLLAVAAGLLAIFNYKFAKIFFWSGICLIAGGMILGPVVQKYAFGQYWTGVPFGWDLTDNKTLLVSLLFIVTMIINRKMPSRTWTILSVVVLLAVYSIPHSMLGSELDRNTGKVIQSVR